MIDKATVERIKAAADIVEVVSDYVHLTRRGANYMGLCPFHNERTPSFSVNKRKNFCYCFSCHKGGSPVNFIMEKEGISYHDALLQLARKYGIKVEERELTDEERQAQSEREAMLVANEWAMELFEKAMRETEEGKNVGLQYFYQRGVTDEAIKKFRLGYSPDNGSWLLNQAQQAGMDIKVLQSVGLIGVSSSGHPYDRFRGRVIYPVLNSAGKVIAFGGRDLKGGPAKYINSPESEIYKKSNELYGIFQAKNAISRQGVSFLVEGYMDVIGMWQSGMENVLASSGTALTDSQIALIHRFSEEVILIYDGDAAGIKAALRGIDMLLAQKLRLKILLLPDGDDPDSFARKHTPEEFRDYVEKNAVDVIKFKTEVLMKDSVNDPVRRSEAIHSIVRSIANIPDKIQRIAYIQECAIALNMPENVILSETEQARAKIIDGWQHEHQRRQLEQEINTRNASPDSISGSDVAHPSPVRNGVTPTSTEKAVKSENRGSGDNRLFPFEKEIVRYCLKYGMVTIFYASDIDGNEIPISTLQYVAEQMEDMNLKLTNPILSTIFRHLQEMTPDFEKDYSDYTYQVEDEIKELRNKGIQEIASGNYDVTRIEIEEKSLEERLEQMRYDSYLDYAILYPGKQLASSEKDDVRTLVTTLLHDEIVLSRRFREMNEGRREVDRIHELVPRALAEWKDATLHCALLEINEKMRQASANDDNEALGKLQAEAFEIMQLRRETAKTIGERIIASR